MQPLSRTSLGDFCPETVQEAMEESAFGIFVVDNLSCASDQDRTIGAIQNSASQVAHDVMAERSARLRSAGHNQVVIAFANLSKDLVESKAMPDEAAKKFDEWERVMKVERYLDLTDPWLVSGGTAST